MSSNYIDPYKPKYFDLEKESGVHPQPTPNTTGRPAQPDQSQGSGGVGSIGHAIIQWIADAMRGSEPQNPQDTGPGSAAAMNEAKARMRHGARNQAPYQPID